MHYAYHAFLRVLESPKRVASYHHTSSMRDGAAGNATVSARRVPPACTGLEMPITIVMAFSWPRISVSDAPVSVAIVIWKRVSLASQGGTCDREPHHVIRLCRFELRDDIL